MAKKIQKREKLIDKYLPIPYEYAFVLLAFIFGLLFVYENPPFHANDEDRHFMHAYMIAKNGPIPVLSGDSTKIGGMIPRSLVQVVKDFQGVPYHKGKKINKKSIDQLKKVELNPINKEFHYNAMYNKFPIAYLPHALAIGLVGDANPVSIGYAARIGGLIFFIIIMFLVIKISPILKPVFFLYGLTPMVLYQCSSVTYDLFSITLSFLFLALYLKYSLEENSFLELKDLLILVSIIITQLLSKGGYFLLPAIFLTLPKKKVRINYFVFLGIFVLILILFFRDSTSMWTSFFDGISSSVKEKTIMQNDFKFSQATRLSNISDDILGFINIYTNNIIHFSSDWLAGVFGRFGYSYSTMSEGFFIFHGLILLAVGVLDANTGYKLSPLQKYFTAGIGLVTMLGVVFGFYLHSPIGSNMIFGFQGRYFIPAIPFVLILTFNNEFKINFWDQYGSLILSGYVLVMMAYTLGEMNKLFYAF